jgi:hypothetical protein
MIPQKTLREREKELQSLLGTPAGRDALEGLVNRYAESGGRMKPPKSSVITYILVHERQCGFICG